MHKEHRDRVIWLSRPKDVQLESLFPHYLVAQRRGAHFASWLHHLVFFHDRGMCVICYKDFPVWFSCSVSDCLNGRFVDSVFLRDLCLRNQSPRRFATVGRWSCRSGHNSVTKCTAAHREDLHNSRRSRCSGLRETGCDVCGR